MSITGASFTSSAYAFTDHLKAFGMTVDGPAHETTDKPIRLDMNDEKNGKRSGWYFYSRYITNGNEAGFGVYGDWRKGNGFEKWCSSNDRSFSPSDQAELDQRIAEQKARAESARKVTQNEAAKKAQDIISQLPSATDHNYLMRKQVAAYGLYSDPADNSLIIPIHNIKNEIRSLQRIFSNGYKRFLRDGEIKGGFHLIGSELTEPTFITEGYATAATIHELTGKAVVVAFNCNNLKPVVDALRRAGNNQQLIIAADNDRHTAAEGKGNPGIDAARKAAQGQHDVYIAIPEFPGPEGTDFNDLYIECGSNSVTTALANSVEPEHLPTNIKWKQPKPLKQTLLPVTPFDASQLLPNGLLHWIEDSASRMDAPIEMPAISAVVALSGLLGGKVLMHPKQYDDWSVTPNLWGAVIGKPSSLKSPTIEAATAPLKSFEVTASEDYQLQLKSYEVAKKLDELQNKEAEQQAKKYVKAGKHSEAEALLMDAVESQPEPPIRKTLIINDTTVEKLAELLNQNPQGITMIRDELMGLLGRLDQEDRQEDRAFYLTAWNGAQRHRTDRIGRGTIIVEQATLALLGGIQPSKLLPYLRDAQSGKSDDGLLQRFQLAVYPNPKTEYTHVDRAPDADAVLKANAVFQRIHDIPFDSEKKLTYRFTKEAQMVFDQWYTATLTEGRAGTLDTMLESYICKSPATVASLALLFHLTDEVPSKDVGITTLNRAINWADFLKSHARRIYALTDDPTFPALQLLKKLNKLDNPFNRRDVDRKQWAGLTAKGDIDEALAILSDNGYLHQQVIETTAKPKTEYFINPCLMKSQ